MLQHKTKLLSARKCEKKIIFFILDSKHGAAIENRVARGMKHTNHKVELDKK